MKNFFQNSFIFQKILFCILIISTLSGCSVQFGSYAVTSSYYSTPRKAFEEADDHYNHLTQTYDVIQEEIGVFKLDDDYSIYIVIMGREKDGEIVYKYPNGLLMKTNNEKFYYMGNAINIDTEKEKDTQSVKTEGKERFIYIIKKDAFDESAYDKENYNINTFSIPENDIITEMVFIVEKLPKN